MDLIEIDWILMEEDLEITSSCGYYFIKKTSDSCEKARYTMSFNARGFNADYKHCDSVVDAKQSAVDHKVDMSLYIRSLI